METREGIKLNKNDVENNPGKRSVSKLLLNTLWGKFAQNENLGKMEVISDPARFFDLVINPAITINSFLPVNEDVVYVGWSHKKENVQFSGLTNVFITAYTTVQARLRLYSCLKGLGARCYYSDTDSMVVYSTGCIGDYEPHVEPLLGELADELTGYGPGSRITEFVSGGPKFYAFRVLKPCGESVYVCKLKGIRLNHHTTSQINFDSIKNMVCERSEAILVSCNNIRTTNFHSVVTKAEKKICRTVYTKR